MIFDKDDSQVTIRVFEIANINDPLKEDELNSLLNNFNLEFPFSSFIQADGNISSHHSMILNDDTDPELIFDSMLRLYNETYPRLMRLKWSD